MFEFYVCTIFSELFEGFLGASLIGKAQEGGILAVRLVDLRDFTHDRHRSVDDAPYGGGAGMVMRPGPVLEMLDSLPRCHRVLLSPQGRRFDQAAAERLAESSPVLLFSGRYEGVDERVRPAFDEELSLGDFVLNGGEVAAMAIIEAVSRLLPGVLGNAASTVEESFRGGLLEYPQFTRPEVVRGRAVPAVLRSGDHAAIARWRRGQALLRTKRRRPDLFAALALGKEDRALIEAAEAEAEPPRAGDEKGGTDAT